jgi:MFS family permease
MTTHKSVIMICLFVYIGGYQIGFGPISWLIISEIFPLEVRGKAVSVAVITNFFWNTLMTFFFPVEIQHIGIAAAFFIYFIILCVGMYFIHTRIPETKGLTLEEISDFFVRSNQVKILNENPSVRNDTDAIDKSEDNYKLSPVI